ncbi:actin-related protein 6 [Nicotiana attenuata]|uniref:Actin-related protein 6 n=1 Tax=Nicotiana attenuata TaxID=49451 RepID=A0A314KZF1_NICAT|nr:actin-related protein 6 [Nicotiana attenuata]
MDEKFLIDDVKEKLCFVSLDVARDLQIARKPGNDNLFRCTSKAAGGQTDKLRSNDGSRRIDLTKNEFGLTNERFLVPEMMFRPADLGLNQAGLAECIVRAISSCHSHLQPLLYESIILTGGTTLFPHFAQRLEMDLRPLVPYKYRLKITTQEDPILGVWRGGSLLASSPDFDAMCVTKAEYEELGSARCRKRFFH